jgi:hypothetical protein
MEVAKLSPWRNWLKTVEKLMENWLKRMKKLIDEVHEDEEIDRKINRRGWRNDSSTFEFVLIEREFVWVFYCLGFVNVDF